MGHFGTSIALDSPSFASTDDDRRILMDAVVMRLSTRKGTYWTQPDYGYPIADLIKATITADSLARIPGDVQAEIEKDQRIRSAKVTATTEATNQRGGMRLVLSIEVTPVSGPTVNFAVAVTDVTVELLMREGG